MWRRREWLAAYTTFRIGGPAEWFTDPQTEEECLLVWHQARYMGGPVRVLSGGSNLLVADEGVPGHVISLRRMSPRRVERHGSRVWVSAGVPLGRLVQWAARAGLSGLEHLAGIPGLLGGAVAMNAGGREGTLGERVTRLDGIDPAGRRVRRRASDFAWAYRSSGLDGLVVLGAELALRRARPADVIARTRSAAARKRASQPLSAWSAGCAFRNPACGAAGKLIDLAGLKGAHHGDAAVAREHANFIINRGKARATDVHRLIERVRRAVRDRFGAQLELEIHCWP